MSTETSPYNDCFEFTFSTYDPRTRNPTLADHPNIYTVDPSSGEHAFEHEDSDE